MRTLSLTRLLVKPCGVALALALLAHTAVQAEKGTNAGIYRDRSGAQQTWQIQRDHTLVWGEKPYQPAGVVFRSAYLKDPSAETLRKDQEELERLKAAGIQDLWVEPGRGLLENTVEQTQALVDLLETRGFRYGVRVGDRTRQPLVGFSPRPVPIQVPVGRLQPGQKLAFDVPVPGGRRAAYLLVDSSPDGRVQNWAIASGESVVENGVARVEIQLGQSRLLGKSRGQLLVVPEIQVEPEDMGSFGDLWGGMETYAGRVKEYLQAVKFGPGLRFILDPFSAGDGTVGQEDQVFPSSGVFRKAFHDWLRSRVGIHTLNVNWRTTDRRIPGFEEAARLVPTWSRSDPPEGDGWLLDPVDHVAYRCKPRGSSVWDDMEAFRSEALKRWMNTITATLKQEGLNVPMLFSWGAYHPMFNNTPSPAGYDGLAAAVFGAAPDVSNTAAHALAQVEEADRQTWLVAARVAGAPLPSGEPAPLADAGQARAVWSAIREAGFRGVYFDPQDTPNAVTLARDLSAALTLPSTGGERPIKTLYFPAPLASADRVMRLSNGVWWLPSSSPARILNFGDDVLGYEIARPFGGDSPVTSGTVLWSNRGQREVSFYLEQFADVQVFESTGTPIRPRLKKSQVQLTLGEEPVVVVGLNAGSIFPLEMAAVALDEMDALLKRAEAQKLEVGSLRAIHDAARKALAPHSAAAIYSQVAPYLTGLREAVMAYIWIEGERGATHNYSGVAFQAGCSGGMYLKLDRADPPASGAYEAVYNIDIRRDASYEIWVAGRVPGRPGISPLVWQIDDEPPVSVPSAAPEGKDYASGMAWFHLGRMTLKVGRHRLTLVPPTKAPGPLGRYSAGIDAIVLSRESFKPNGIEKPFQRLSASR